MTWPLGTDPDNDSTNRQVAKNRERVYCVLNEKRTAAARERQRRP